MSRSPDRRSSLERGSPETKPRSCGTQPAHESLFNRRLRVRSPAVRTSEPTSSATAEQIVASEPLKANMRLKVRFDDDRADLAAALHRLVRGGRLSERETRSDRQDAP